MIAAPRPELYDVATDPAEARNLLTERRAEARRLRTLLEDLESGFERRRGDAPPEDPELAAQLRSLGYLSTPSGREGTIDPKDGVKLLADFEHARHLMGSGDTGGAARLLSELVAKNPGSVPFRSRLAAAQLETGQAEAAIATYRAAIELGPRLDFLHQNLADAYFRLGRFEQASAEYQLTLQAQSTVRERLAATWRSWRRAPAAPPKNGGCCSRRSPPAPPVPRSSSAWGKSRTRPANPTPRRHI